MTIKELAETVMEVVGFQGQIVFDSRKPDGTPRKIMDSSKINRMGWAASTNLQEGLVKTYNWLLENSDKIRI